MLWIFLPVLLWVYSEWAELQWAIKRLVHSLSLPGCGATAPWCLQTLKPHFVHTTDCLASSVMLSDANMWWRLMLSFKKAEATWWLFDSFKYCDDEVHLLSLFQCIILDCPPPIMHSTVYEPQYPSHWIIAPRPFGTAPPYYVLVWQHSLTTVSQSLIKSNC